MNGPARRLVPFFAVLAALALPSFATAAKPDPAAANERPDPATVRRYGPAYRYPRAGWIVLHVEGAPYERGYQHGRLLADEIADYVKTLATKRSHKDPGAVWNEARTTVNALFLRRYDQEFLEEMKGTADGAANAGATFLGRPIDFLDVVTLNSDIELEFLQSALDATATGLEGKTFREPPDQTAKPAPPEHCSAFAATGSATADGKVVLGHITMFSLPFVRHFNVWLDVKPEHGHRVLMQTYPGGIQSGMDYYLNDAGLIVAETTLEQTKFDQDGTALASRIRKALQYADSIDKAVEILKEKNNGLYTNEWLLADTKTDEIAMFELGTHRSKLWRSGKDEWYGGTKGFYWGCNNAKDLAVRLETAPGVEGRPANVVYHPSDRDVTWLKLYEKHKGKIGPAFGFEAFTTPPLSAFSSCDAKFTTSAMAKDLKTWALFGPPLGRTWDPTPSDLARWPEVRPLVGNDWTVLTAEPPPSPSKGDSQVAVDLKPADHSRTGEGPGPGHGVPHPPAWHGTLTPGDDSSLWLAAAFADYEKIVSRELALRARAAGRGLNRAEKDEIAVDLFAPYSRYRTAVSRFGKDVPLAETSPHHSGDEWYQIAAGKGTLLLAALRDKVGDGFLKTMDDFGRAHAGKPADAKAVTELLEALPAADREAFRKAWLEETGLPGRHAGHFWSIDSFERELDHSVIVYGTAKESDAQKEAADRLQRAIQRKWSNVAVPILADRDATREAIRGRHVLLVGRPETNSAASGLVSRLPVKFGPASFVLKGETYGHARTSVIAAGPRPDDPRYEVVVFAGLSSEATWKCVEAVATRGGEPAEVLLMPANGGARRLVVGEADEPARAASLTR